MELGAIFTLRLLVFCAIFALEIQAKENDHETFLKVGRALIEQCGNKLEQNRFEGDPTVVQSVDRINRKTYYKQGDDIVFERDAIDSRKPVVVLNAGEDGLKITKRKRIFVVLKKKENEDKTYWVTFAYLRAFLKKEDPSEMVTIEGEKLRIEWDTWTLRGNSHNAARAFGWTTCTESVFVACKKDGSKKADLDYEDEVTAVHGIQLSNLTGGEVKTEVKEPTWGLNIAAESSVGRSDFVATLTGKAGYAEATNDGSGTTEGGDMEETYDFFADLDDTPAESRMVSDADGSAVKTGADFFSQVGWKTQDMEPNEIASQLKKIESHEDAFIGYGTCPYNKQSSSDLNNIQTPIDAVNFYLTTLRNQCSRSHLIKISSLFLKGILTLNKDNTLSVPESNVLVKTSKLTRAETEDLSRGYETAMFTQAFAAELRNPSPASVDPEGRTVSRSVFTIIRMALHALDDAQRHIPAHYILVTRNLVQTLKSTNTKSLQDYDRIKNCTSCTKKEIEIALADIYSLQAIQQFILKGLAAVVSAEQTAFHAYEQYFKKKRSSIVSKTKRYL